jgi:UDP-2,4-diacetamido-2,4,6-trideoxy-beta-L-altropyranose hydrolase
MRCLALAEELAAAGWQVHFAVGSQTPVAAPALRMSGFEMSLIDAPAAREADAMAELIAGGVDLLVVDHYERDVEFERKCRAFARRILVNDDRTGRTHDCDILLDSAAADASVYSGRVPDSARILAGPAFALLRRSVLAARQASTARRDGRPVRDILVSFGATDPANLTPVALDALGGLDEAISVTVAMSAASPHIDEVRRRATGRMRLALDGTLVELMTNADLAIGGAGVTAFERASLGVPSIVVTIADNQSALAQLLVEGGAAIDAGPVDARLGARLTEHASALVDDPDKRICVAKAAMALVDGWGARRTMVALAGPARLRDGAEVRLRLVESSDERWLLELQRVPATRRYAGNSSVPSAAEHAAWLRRTLNNPAIYLMIIDVAGEPAAMLRLDRKDVSEIVFEISIAVMPDYQGRGTGNAALALARQLVPAARIDAVVKPENIASQKLFAGAGYRRTGEQLFSSVLSGHKDAADDNDA